MAQSTGSVATQTLSLVDEFILTLLNEESGYFHQVPGWDLNCAVAGAALAELSLQSRIDTDMDSLILLDPAKTGDPVLDPILEKIAADPGHGNAQYWIERLAVRAESVIDSTLERLVLLKILEHHDGDFWTLARTGWQADLHAGSLEGTAAEFVTTRLSRMLFGDEIPGPRDIIIICLLNTCDVLRFIFQLDDESEERVELISKMEVIGRAIAEAIEHSQAGPLLRRVSLTKKIPSVSLSKLLRNRHVRDGNLPALFAGITEEYGPVFKIKFPFMKPLIFLAGPRANRWVHRNGRLYLRTGDYFADLEKVYGASGVLPALDGADHFRLRKAMHPALSRGKLESRLDDLFAHGRRYLSSWKIGDSLQATHMCRRMINSETSPLLVSVDSQDVIDDVIAYKERALNTHISRLLPKFLLHTPSMKRRSTLVTEVRDRVQSVHTPAQRSGCPRELADDLLSLHMSDPQFLPEANLGFALSTPLLAAMYLGDSLGFALYAMVSQPELYERIRSEADALFADGDPDSENLVGPATDVTRRFIMECMRLYPSVPASIRNVMNTCVVEGYQLSEGMRLHIFTTAPHYMKDVFPEPYKFDIDRYLPSRKEHLSPGYAPYGLGTHTCLGFRWMELQLAVNLLLIARYVSLELSPPDYKLKFNPFPSMSPSKKMKFVVSELRHELPV